jgi:hypothetical protein
VNEATCDRRQFIYQELDAGLETPEEAMAVPLLMIGSHGGRLRDRGWYIDVPSMLVECVLGVLTWLTGTLRERSTTRTMSTTWHYTYA